MIKIILADDLLEQGISQAHVAERPGVSRRTMIG
jgi:predicted transcriptional regulator